MWWMVAGQAAMGALQYLGGKKSQSVAASAAASNAQLIEMENTEELRRMNRTQAFRMSEAIAQTGAAGIQQTGSAANVIQALEAEYKKQYQWQLKTGSQRVDVAKKGGAGAGTAMMYQGVAQIGSALLSSNQSGTGGWWKPNPKVN